MKTLHHLTLLFLASLVTGCASIATTDGASEGTEAAHAEDGAAAKNDEVSSARFDKLWNYQDVDATRERFEALLEEAETSWTQDLHLQLLTQVARTYSLQRKFEQAHGLLDEVKDALPGGNSLASVRYCLERGRTFNSAGKAARACNMFKQAWKMANELEQAGYAVDAAHMLGIAEEGQASLDWCHLAMQVAEDSSDPSVKGWLGPLYNNTGWTHHDNGDYEAAMDLWVKAEAWHQEFGSQSTQRIARWTVARCERSLGNCAKALELQLDLLQEEGVAREDIGYTHEEIAENLVVLERLDEAREHFAAAHEILSKDAWLQANEPERLARLARMAQGSPE